MGPSPRLRRSFCMFILPRAFRSSRLARCAFFAVVLVLISASAFAQVINTVAGGFNPSAAASQNACLPIRAATFLQGNAYVMSCNRVFKVDTRGNWTLVAGNGKFGFSGDGSAATSASMAEPRSVGADASGNVYIFDEFNNRVREVVASTGIIQTIAGTGTPGYSGDGGQAVNAQIATGNRASLYVDPSTGDVYIADSGNNVIRKVTVSTGVISTVAGTGTRGFTGDGGLATSARLRSPEGVFVDAFGNIFIADSGNQRVREVVASTGNIQTIAGNGTAGFSGDGGPATSAELSQPDGVFFDSSDNLFISDQTNNRIRKVDSTGTIHTIAGNGQFIPNSCNTSFDLCFGNGGAATNAAIYSPQSVWEDQGNLFIVTLVYGVQEIPSGNSNLQNFAGNGAIGFGGDGGPALSAQLDTPVGVAVDNSGNVYIADQDVSGFSAALKEVVASTGEIKTIAGKEIGSLALSGDGGPATAATTQPNGVFVDASQNIFIADGLGEVREISAATGIIEAVAGNGAPGYSGDGGPAISAQVSPTGVFIDGSGNIFIADGSNHRVREVVGGPGGNIVTVAGNGTPGFGGDGGPATSAELDFPSAVWLDHSGNIFIADEVNPPRIRKGQKRSKMRVMWPRLRPS